MMADVGLLGSTVKVVSQTARARLGGPVPRGRGHERIPILPPLGSNFWTLSSKNEGRFPLTEILGSSLGHAQNTPVSQKHITYQERMGF